MPFVNVKAVTGRDVAGANTSSGLRAGSTPASGVPVAGSMAEALRRLSPEHRQALLECHCRHSSVAAAATCLGISTESVKARTHDALHAVRLTLAELEAERSAAT
jgi:DNA-directed RNA polymerase specialized sigma24 family protein